jgi:multidrug efflux pump subunit AcrA (membrane-fusion protein)
MKKPILNSILYFVAMISLAACSSVETTKPTQADIVNAVFASGFVICDHEYQVTANAEGYLSTTFVEEGDGVKAGMPLFQLAGEVQSEQLSNARINYEDALRKLNNNAPERVQLELQVEQARLQMEQDKKNYERYSRLRSTEAVSQLDFEKMENQYENSKRNVAIQEKALADLISRLELNVKNAKSQLIIQQETHSDYFLSSAIDGEVLQVFKQPGELVRRGEVVAKIGGGVKLAKLYVSEEDIKEVVIDQTVVFNLNTDRENVYEGSISKIYPSFDEIEQSFVVEATFKKGPSTLYHNTQLQANIIIDQRTDALVIPRQFLSEGDSVTTKGGVLRYVQVGIRNEQWVEILDGVDPGDVLLKTRKL